jgi:hypothetical protein
MYALKLNKLIKYVAVGYIVMCCMNLSLSAQSSSSKDFVISAQGHYGFIIGHRPDMQRLIKGNIYGGELNYIYRTCGNECWQGMYNYPEFGFCMVHLNLGNNQELGSLTAIYPYTNLRLTNARRNFRLNLRLGFGLAYISKPYDVVNNPYNVAIGSHYNGFVNLRFSTFFMITSALRLDAGVGFSHASNGAIKMPNLGLNMPSVNLGIGYVFGSKTMCYKRDTLLESDLKKDKHKWHASLIGVMGIKESEKYGSAEYTAYGLIYNMYYTKNYKNQFGGGLELAYNNATIYQWKKDSVSNIRTRDVLQVGCKVGYAFTFNRLSFPIDFGVYVYKKQPLNGWFFHRIGVRYMVTKHLIANVTLLTHFAKADYFEWGIGYQF